MVAVEERLAVLTHRFELGEEVRQQLHVPLVDGLELRELGLGLAVV